MVKNYDAWLGNKKPNPNHNIIWLKWKSSSIWWMSSAAKLLSEARRCFNPLIKGSHLSLYRLHLSYFSDSIIITVILTRVSSSHLCLLCSSRQRWLCSCRYTPHLNLCGDKYLQSMIPCFSFRWYLLFFLVSRITQKPKAQYWFSGQFSSWVCFLCD